MKVAFDAHPLFAPRTGVGYHLLHLLKGIDNALACADIDEKYRSMTLEGTVFSLKNKDLGAFKFSNRVKLRVFPFPGRALFKTWRYLGLPRYDMLCPGRDVYHFCNFVLPPLKTSRAVITVHDLTFVKYPDFVESRNLRHLKALMPDSLKKARAVVTVSNTVKKELQECFGLKPENITVVPNGVDRDIFKPFTDKSAVKTALQSFGFPRHFILAVSTIEPRKNLETLLAAYKILKDSHPEVKLVIAGGLGWKYQNFFKTMQKLGISNDVRVTGYADEKLMPLLYNGAEIFVSTSHYEGFGMPLLEAASCGLPVVCSSIDTYKEFFSDCSRMFDPCSAEQLAQILDELLTKRPVRRPLVAKGLELAQRMSWLESAKKLLELYYRVGNDA